MLEVVDRLIAASARSSSTPTSSSAASPITSRLTSATPRRYAVRDAVTERAATERRIAGPTARAVPHADRRPDDDPPLCAALSRLRDRGPAAAPRCMAMHVERVEPKASF